MGQAKLIADLEALSPCAGRDELLKRVRENKYHDFKSAYTFPKLTLHNELTAAGYLDLAARVQEGRYDDQPDAIDIAEMQANTPREILEALGLPTTQENN